MAKTVYIETTVPSAFASQREDAASVYRRATTRQWWTSQSGRYGLCTSEATLGELRAGTYPSRAEAIALVESLPRLPITDEVVEIARLYVRHRLMPESVGGDALHLAVASLHEMDYLLTWNVRHLANPNKVEHMTVINRRLGLLSPAILSPEELWMEEPHE